MVVLSTFVDKFLFETEAIRREEERPGLLCALGGSTRPRFKHNYGIPRTIRGPISRVSHTGSFCQVRIMRW